MSKTAHTPGPWRVHCDPCHYDTASDVSSDCGQLFASVGGKAGWQEQEANARLIAAAPDLLEALFEADRFLSHPLDPDDIQMARDVIRAAIAKAKGGAE